jgi:ubiquitin carboxyl-terminal hydrolase 9/24
MLIEQLMV